GYWMDEVPAGEWRVAVRGGQVFDQAKLIRDHLQENWASKLQGHDAYRKALDMVAQISQHEQALAGGEPDAEAKRRLLTSLMGWKKELAKISIGDILKPKIT
ncbi:hypothetical protein HYV73_04830, partial [Candidatus Uhrbacteria bacterium]|nr:hypothetical protein [Candidatus Uhrbacteria bacterium]